MRLATINQLRNAHAVPINGFLRDLFTFPVAFGERAVTRDNGLVLDVYETSDGYTVKSDLPGFDKESINLTYENKTLTLSGERKREEGEGLTFHRVESFTGQFSRSIKLPVEIDVEKISAELSNGVLTVKLPKAEAARPKQIDVNVG